jgi:hypothetical protein
MLSAFRSVRRNDRCPPCKNFPKVCTIDQITFFPWCDDIKSHDNRCIADQRAQSLSRGADSDLMELLPLTEFQVIAKNYNLKVKM